MKRYSTIMSVLLTLALPVAGTCADTPKPAEKGDAKVEAIKETMSKSRHGMMMGGNAEAADGSSLNASGKVIETAEGGGYTYANLQGKDGKKAWVAYPTLETKIGDTLSFTGCMEMTQFESKALKRKFESILFCSGPDAKSSKMAGKAKPAAKPQASAAGTFKPMKVDKATGPNAYTVAEVFEKRAALHGKQVVVKGQVAKVASGIMGKNWIHLQDGSGSEKKKNNDLVITSATDSPEIGEVVTVTGTVAKDKNFGSGYKYDVILEKGSVKK